MDKTQENVRQLKVYWANTEVGILFCDPNGDLSFVYQENWPSEKPISFSMPTSNKIYQKEAHNFFANLLPEGDFRRKIERLFQTSPDNDFGLLEIIGGDCAGALTVAHEPYDEEEAFYETLSQEKITKIVETEGLYGLKQANQIGRLSLAGAQGKLPLYKEDDQYSLPQKGAPSTHILKFNRLSHGYPRIVENEFFMTQIARYLGLDVIQCQLLKVGEHFVFLSERYDRIVQDEGWPIKLHQEDFCQALAYSHQRKYEKEGGPGFLKCAQLVKQYLGIVPFNRMIEWFLFNIVLGNSDAHAKNISLVYELNGSVRLAPFYDLVCTRAYENLDTNLAMAFAGEFNPDLLRKQHLKFFADELQVTYRFIHHRFKSLMERIPDAIDKAKADLVEQGYELRLMQHVILKVEHLYQSAKKNLLN